MSRVEVAPRPVYGPPTVSQHIVAADRGMLRECIANWSNPGAPPVPGFTADELLKRAVRQARARDSRKGQRHPRWVAVMDACIVGSTYAGLLCRWAGLDPDEMVKR